MGFCHCQNVLLKFEVPPSDAGTVVDGLHAQGFDASLENKRPGRESYVVVVEVAEDDVEEMRDAMRILASNWKVVS